MKTQNNSYCHNEINGNLSIPIIVKTDLHDWQVKNKTGTVRKRLEQINIDGPRLTSLVQFPPGLTFKKATHDRGEEFLVLSGDFANDKKIYNCGAYVRNPPGMKHTSATRNGCTLLFKTGQFQKLDNNRRVVQPYELDTLWQTTNEPGVSRAELHQFLDETVSLYNIRPQCWITFRQYTHSIEILVCEGSITVSGIKYPTGTWFRYPPNSRIKITSVAMACLFVKKSKFHIRNYLR
jgi:hypothetical protein